MTIKIKTPEDIEKMRIAGRLASELLDYITPFVVAGTTTERLDELCHAYMRDVQGTIPAPLNYAPPATAPFPSPSAPPSITRSATASRVTGSLKMATSSTST